MENSGESCSPTEKCTVCGILSMFRVTAMFRVGVILFLSIIVGVITGVASFVLYFLTQLFTKFFLWGLDNFNVPPSAGEIEIVHLNFHIGAIPLFIIPAIGGIIVGIVTYALAPETAGGGTGYVIDAFHGMRGYIRSRVPIIKTIISAITIGSGGSAGREGPITQIGGGIGSIVARFCKLSDRDRRILVVSGMSGGIGSVFLAPLGGAFFGVEVLYKRDFEVDALIPAVVSSIVAYTVLETILCEITGVSFGHVRIFSVPNLKINSPIELMMYAILGIIAGAFGYLYIYCYHYTKNLFKRFRIPDYLKPAIGGFTVGIMGVFIHQILSTGYGYTQMVLVNCSAFAVTFLIFLAIAKIVATAMTVGSGGSGGLFAPSLVIGSFLGGAIGLIFHSIMPQIVPEAYALVGMAAFLAGTSKTPLTAIILPLEITGSYSLLPATMIASFLAYLVTGERTLYTKQVRTRADSPAHRRELIRGILIGLKVRDAMTPVKDIVTVSPEDTVQDVLSMVRKTGHLGYPVTKDGKLVGIVTLTDINSVPEENRTKIRVKDVMSRNVITISPDDNLEDALKLLIEYDIGRLPVVEDEKLVGIITRSDIMKAHAKELERLGI